MPLPTEGRMNEDENARWPKNPAKRQLGNAE
jgi:hypothetical protein